MPDEKVEEKDDKTDIEELGEPEKIEEEVTAEGEKTEEAEAEEEEEEVESTLPRPSFKDIKAKYPHFFADFPALRDAFFREKEFSSIFSTVEDAREAQEDLESLSILRDNALDGNIGPILESIKEADADAFKKSVTDFLPAVFKINPELFMEALTPSIENMLRQAHRDGAASSNDDLTNSALHISKWLFGTPDVALGRTSGVKPSTGDDGKLKKERDEFEATKFRDAYNNITENRNEAMRLEIVKGLDDLVLTPYLRDKLVEDIIDKVDKQLANDSSHMVSMSARWRRAKSEGYSSGSKNAILTAYLARAKQLIPSVRAKLKAGALPARPSSAGERKEIPVGRESRSATGLPSVHDIDWGKTTDLDILNDKVQTRR